MGISPTTNPQIIFFKKNTCTCIGLKTQTDVHKFHHEKFIQRNYNRISKPWRPPFQKEEKPRMLLMPDANLDGWNKAHAYDRRLGHVYPLCLQRSCTITWNVLLIWNHKLVVPRTCVTLCRCNRFDRFRQPGHHRMQLYNRTKCTGSFILDYSARIGRPLCWTWNAGRVRSWLGDCRMRRVPKLSRFSGLYGSLGKNAAFWEEFDCPLNGLSTRACAMAYPSSHGIVCLFTLLAFFSSAVTISLWIRTLLLMRFR